jgi:hypothetical protein
MEGEELVLPIGFVAPQVFEEGGGSTLVEDSAEPAAFPAATIEFSTQHEREPGLVGPPSFAVGEEDRVEGDLQSVGRCVGAVGGDSAQGDSPCCVGFFLLEAGMVGEVEVLEVVIWRPLARSLIRAT